MWFNVLRVHFGNTDAVYVISCLGVERTVLVLILKERHSIPIITESVKY